MRNIFFILLFLPFLGVAQPTEVAAKKIRATEKLQLSDKTLTAIVEAITVLSTHAQSPTAKAVYDLTAAMITSVSTNATLSGNGTAGDPLGIAQQSATSGQVLKWNGSAWLPAADDNTTQTLSYSAPNLSLSGGGGSVAIPQGDITGSGVSGRLAYFNGTKTITSSSRMTFADSTLNINNGINIGNGLRNIRIIAYNDKIDMQSYPSVPLIVNELGNEVRFPGAATSVPAFLQISPTGTISSALEIRNNPSFFEVQSYSKPLYLNRQGNNVLVGVDARLGVGTESPTNLLHVNGTGRMNQLGLGTSTPSEMLHLSGGRALITAGVGTQTGLIINSQDASLGTDNEYRIDFAQQLGILGRINGRWSGTTYDIDIAGYAGGLNKVATFKGNGRMGVGTTNPLQLLHVEGVARITGSSGTGTSVMLRNASGDISNATIGTGLSLSGGTLSSTATGTVGGTGIANKVAYWSGTNTLTATNNFAFDGTNLSVGTATPGAGRLNVVGNNSSVSFQVNAGTLPSFGSTIQTTATAAAGETIYGLDMTGNTTGVTTTNYLHRLENSGTGSTILQVNTASAGGDPAVQYNLVGAATKWIHGIDNSSEGNSFKLQPFAQLGDGATGLTITTAGLFGINKEAPGASIDMDATTDGIALSSGNTANRPASSLRWLRYNSSMLGLETRTASANWHVLNSSQSVSLAAGGALGSAPTITINGGTEMAYTVSLRAGTSPTANAVIYTRTFPNTWSVAPTVVFSAANQLTASEITKFYVDTQTTGSYTIRANGTLTAGQTYKLNVIIRN